MTTPRETADHAELARLAERCTHGDPWYKEGDLCGRQTFEQFLPQDRAFIAAANPATVLALLSEIAALRGEVAEAEKDADDWAENLAELRAESQRHLLRATQAERQRDELRTEAVYLLRHVQVATSAIHDPEYKAAGYRYQVTPMANATHDRIRAFLANQGADQ